MAGILDLFVNNPIFDVQNPESIPAGPPNTYKPPEQEPNRINELLSELNKQDRFDAVQALRTADRQKFSPDYIYNKDYKKSSYSFFGDGYDANVDVEVNPEDIEKEFSDFLKTIGNPDNLDNVFGSGTLSPFAEDMLPEIGRYREQHQALPSSFKDFIMNRYTGKS